MGMSFRAFQLKATHLRQGNTYTIHNDSQLPNTERQVSILYMLYNSGGDTLLHSQKLKILLNNKVGSLPVAPSLEPCSLKYMNSKLTNVHEEENKESERTVTPEKERGRDTHTSNICSIFVKHYY